MLPEGWTTAPLGTCAKFLSGGTPSKADEDYWGGDFPWITVRDMKSLRLENAGLTLTEKGAAVSSIAPQNAVLVVTRGMALLKDLPVGITTRPMAFNQDIKALVANEGIDPQYLAYQLQANKTAILDLVDTAGHGTGRLDTDLLKQFAIPVAPEEEQQKIASRIRLWDDAITTTEKLLANARTAKKALAGQLLGAHHNWKSVGFNELFKVINRKETQVVASEYLPQGRMPIIDQGQRFIAGYTEDDAIYVDPPMIVFGDHTRAVKWVDFRFRLGADGTQLLSPRPSIHPKLAYHLLANAAIPNLGYSRHMSVVKQLRFSIPTDEDEQSAIAMRLDTADKAIASIEAQARCLVKEKKALMQDLLTGKRRVKLPSTDTVATPP